MAYVRLISIKATSCCARPRLRHLAVRFKPSLSPLAHQSCSNRCSCSLPLLTLAFAWADSDLICDIDCIVTGLSANTHKVK